MRFAPILTEAGTPVHTCYVASTPQAACMESLLHDVPLSPPGLFEVASLAHFHLVCRPASLRYVSFHTPFLPRLAIARAQLIDSLAACYPQTWRGSQAAYLRSAAMRRRSGTASGVMIQPAA